MPNWTAWRWKFKRSRRLQMLAFMVVFAVSLTIVQVAIQTLNPPPEGPTAVVPDGEDTLPPERISVGLQAPTWRVGDHWAWEDGWGLRIVDRVVDVEARPNGARFYHVEREASSVDGRLARVDNVTYDASTLAVRSVEYPNGYTLRWHERTLGLVHTSTRVGYASNMSILLPDGSQTPLYRVANVTRTGEARVGVGAGFFEDVTYIQVENKDYNIFEPTKSTAFAYARWYSPTVGNDVAFRLPNGTMMKLVGYRSAGGSHPVPEMPVTPTWRPGVTWRYEAPDGATLQRSVVDVRKGHTVVVEEMDIQQGHAEELRYYRSDNLAPVNYTFYGALFEIDPHGVPLAQLESAEFQYTKRIHLAEPRTFETHANVTARSGALVETDAGVFDAWRIDVVERETGEDGKTITLQTLRFYAPEVGNDVRFHDGSRLWTLASVTFPPAPVRPEVMLPAY